MERKCAKCGEPLNEGDANFCVFCQKNRSKNEQEDIDSWVKREEDEDW